MWYYNLFTNMWQEFVLDTSGSFVQPPRLKDHVFVASELGLIIYGGVSWTPTNMTFIDAEIQRRLNYVSECEAFIISQGFTVADIGSAAFDQKYIETGNICYKAFPTEERDSIWMNKDIYFFPQKECQDDCNNRGICLFGRCTCA